MIFNDSLLVICSAAGLLLYRIHLLCCRWPAAGPDPSALLPLAYCRIGSICFSAARLLKRFAAATKPSAAICCHCYCYRSPWRMGIPVGIAIPRGERGRGAKSAPRKKSPRGPVDIPICSAN
ncbi:hypothetical protein SLEP1_g57358 [Rubroshorea leprosula]|uniref:Secreted protein n=1 Tax=Rubroshorea leprosula TaxID=152421 RepID=A0AAV5MME4_9ROSI|nr:hypothetical protein SLEP1_g57358 [Rubroshorea leprosula]